MCGRYTLSDPGDLLQELGVVTSEALAPRYNIAPTQEAAVVRQEADGARQLRFLHWGLIPPWAKEKSIGNRMINARSETVAEKVSFKRPLRAGRRCLVLTDGFYEWQKVEGGKQPFHIHLPERRPFTFAGLWERWSRGPEPIESFTILTIAANPKIEPVHHRMPVILPPDLRDLWLASEENDPEVLTAILTPYPEEEIELTPVGRLVGNPRNDSPLCLEPVEI